MGTASHSPLWGHAVASASRLESYRGRPAQVAPATDVIVRHSCRQPAVLQPSSSNSGYSSGDNSDDKVAATTVTPGRRTSTRHE